MSSVNDRIRKVRKDSLMYLLSNVIVGISGLVSIKLYTNIYSKQDYGDYSLIIGTLGLVLSLIIGWVDNSVIRFTDGYIKKTDAEGYYSTVFTLLCIIDSVTIIVLFILSNIFKSQLGNLYKMCLLTIILIVPQSFSTILNSVLRATGNSKIYSLNNIILSIGKIAFVYILFIAFNMNINSIIISMIICYIITSIIGFKVIGIGKFISVSKFSKNIMKQFISYGVPLIGLSLTVWILSLSDRYVIKFFGNSEQVAIYSVCYGLGANIFSIINNFMMLAAYPVIIETWNNYGKNETEDLLNKLLKYYFYIAIPAFLGALAVGKPLIQVFSSSKYLEGYEVFCMVSLGVLLWGVTNYTNKPWELTKKTYMILILNAVAAVVNLALNFILIPIIGYKIAAATTVASYLIYLVVSLLKSRNIFSIKINLKSFIKTIIASVVMFIIVKIVFNIVSNYIIGLILSVIVGITTYIIIMLLFNEINEEIKVIGVRMKNKIKL